MNCYICQGTGELECHKCQQGCSHHDGENCPECEGDGLNVCHRCNGNGLID